MPSTLVTDIDPSDLAFTTAPVAGIGEMSGQSVVLLDRELGDEWTALREDWGPYWIRDHGAELVGPVP